MWLHFVTIPKNWLETGTSFWKKTHPLPQSSSWANSGGRHSRFSKGSNDLLWLNPLLCLHTPPPFSPSNANGGFSPRRRTRWQPADSGPARGAGWAGDNFPTFSSYQLDLLPSIFHRQKSHPGSRLTPQLCHPQDLPGDGSDSRQKLRDSVLWFPVHPPPCYPLVVESHLHGCPVFDVILLSQLLTGEVHVLLPQPLALPTGFLRRITNIKGRKKKIQYTTNSFKNCKNSPIKLQVLRWGWGCQHGTVSAGLSSTGGQRPQKMGAKGLSKAQENGYKMNL